MADVTPEMQPETDTALQQTPHKKKGTVRTLTKKVSKWFETAMSGSLPPSRQTSLATSLDQSPTAAGEQIPAHMGAAHDQDKDAILPEVKQVCCMVHVNSTELYIYCPKGKLYIFCVLRTCSCTKYVGR